MQRYLAVAYGLTSLPKLRAEQLTKLMHQDRVNNVVDLASGAGGPIPIVAKEVRRLGFDLNVTLTDRFPNPAATTFPYYPEPIDARRIPATLTGIRTMFASFHHFRPAEARDILRDAYEHRTPICILRRHRGPRRPRPS